jgi:hypothetical protein
MSNNDEELDPFEDDNAAFLARIRENIRNNDPALLALLHEEGFLENDAIPDGSDDDTDSTWVPSTRSGASFQSADEFILQIYDARVLQLHNPIDIGNLLYPGPMNTPVLSLDDECDCSLFNGNIDQCLLNQYHNNWLDIDFQTELNAAIHFRNHNHHREPNNLQRKRMYRDIWKNLGNHVELEHDEQTGRYARIRLPNCSYALVRMIWPSVTGQYMGFRLF